MDSERNKKEVVKALYSRYDIPENMSQYYLISGTVEIHLSF